jgi:protoporphyrinogen oxidase
VVVLGGGLSGVATAHALAEAGWTDITIVERAAALGGLAGSFERDGHFYPLGYHHILARDRTLLFFLERIGALSSVRWRKIRMLFRLGDGRLYDLGRPRDFLRFPMSLADKLRFVTLMLRAFGKSDWTDWLDKDAAALLDAWAGPGVRQALFEPLTRLKFELPCREVSGAWLGARLHFREGSSPLGYIPHANWTKVLCDGVTRLVTEQGVRVRLREPVARLRVADGRIVAAELESGESLAADLFVSSVPTEVFLKLVPHDESPQLGRIRYTALLSVVCATRARVTPDFYWMNLASLDRTACGLFVLSSLNPTIGGPGESCVNFVTHLRGRDRELFSKTDEQLLSAYLEDFRAIFGFPLEPSWTHIARIPMYSPIFDRGYRNPPLKSSSWRNLYFTGNYRSFPSVASTGTALRSGLLTADAMLRDHGAASELLVRAERFSR